MIFNYNDKMKLKEEIIKLNKHDWFQIYIILKNNKESFTTNNSGLFFDLINISNDSLELVKNYIENLKSENNLI